MKIVVLLASAALILTGCEPTAYPVREANQKERQRIFKECLAAVPKGPVVTGDDNPWSEVISECAEAAYYQSLECVENCPGDKKKEEEQ